MSYFKGKTIIVTGASSGIGEATAKEFLSQGAKVILVSRSESKMQDSFKDFNSSFSDTNSSRTRSFLKIQDGCDYKCTYCTIPLARGQSRSDSIKNIVKNVKKIVFYETR